MHLSPIDPMVIKGYRAKIKSFRRILSLEVFFLRNCFSILDDRANARRRESFVDEMEALELEKFIKNHFDKLLALKADMLALVKKISSSSHHPPPTRSRKARR